MYKINRGKSVHLVQVLESVFISCKRLENMLQCSSLVFFREEVTDMRKNKAIVVILVVLALVVGLGVYGMNVLNATTSQGDKSIVLGLDLSGGVSITYQIMTENPTQTDIEDTIAKLEERAENYSTEYAVYQVGEDRITVEIPGVFDANAVLEELGIYVEEFSTTAIRVSEIPLWMQGTKVEVYIKDVIEELLHKPSIDIPSIRSLAIASLSCKASIRANHALNLDDMQNLVTTLLKCENPNTCPHGRPTILKYSKYELEKFFKRVG